MLGLALPFVLVSSAGAAVGHASGPLSDPTFGTDGVMQIGGRGRINDVRTIVAGDGRIATIGTSLPASVDDYCVEPDREAREQKFFVRMADANGRPARQFHSRHASELIKKGMSVRGATPEGGFDSRGRLLLAVARSGKLRTSFFRLTRSGAIDKTFGRTGMITVNGYASSLAVSPDGSFSYLLTNGDSGVISCEERPSKIPSGAQPVRLHRRSANGVSIEFAGAPGGIAMPRLTSASGSMIVWIEAFRLLADGSSIVVGRTQEIGGFADSPKVPIIGHYLADGRLDLSFGSSGFVWLPADRVSDSRSTQLGENLFLEGLVAVSPGGEVAISSTPGASGKLSNVLAQVTSDGHGVRRTPLSNRGFRIDPSFWRLALLDDDGVALLYLEKPEGDKQFRAASVDAAGSWRPVPRDDLRLDFSVSEFIPTADRRHLLLGSWDQYEYSTKRKGRTHFYSYSYDFWVKIAKPNT